MTLVPLSRDRHAGKGWRRYSSYGFASTTALVPLVAAELAKAIQAMPVGFIEQGEATIPVAILGLEPGQNLYVAEDGRWLGSYVPAALRGYPFALARTEQGLVLCINEASGLLVEDGTGEPFFGEDGQITQAVKEVLDFLTQIEANRAATSTAMAALQEQGLIKPWPIAVQVQDQQRPVQGLFRVSEKALQALEADQLAAVHRAGGLPIVYGQLFSMSNLSLLGQLAQAKAQRLQAQQQKPEQAGGFALPESDTIDFNW